MKFTPSDEVMAAKETQINAAPKMGFAVEPPEASKQKTLDSYFPLKSWLLKK